MEQASRFLAAIVSSSEDAILSKTLDGIIASWNQGAERLFGYSAQEAIGQPITLIIPADRVAEEEGILERIRHGERLDHFETIRQRKDGSLVPVSLAVSPVRDSEGNIIAASKIARDITERQAAERRLLRTSEALRQATSLLKAISDNTGDVIFAKDRSGRLTFANPATLRLIGKPLEQVLGKTDVEFLQDSAAAREVMENDRRIMESGVAEDVEEEVPLPDGTHRVWFSRKMPYRDAEGRVVGLLGPNAAWSPQRTARQQAA